MTLAIPLPQAAPAVSYDPSYRVAAQLVGPRRFDVVRSSRPEPGRDEVRVRLEGCGVCASSLPTWAGRPWFSYPLAAGQLGHEGWGVIDAVGPGVAPEQLGTRVAVLADGAFATEICVPLGKVLPLPESLAGQPVPLEPLGCAINILRRSAVAPGQPVAIVGCGFIGALLVQLLHHRGHPLTVFTRRSYARKLALACGADTALPLVPLEELHVELRRLGVGGFPRVIEAVGSQDALDLASALVAPGGRLVIAGYHQDGHRSVNLQDWNWKGIDVINAHERDEATILRGMRGAIDALESHTFNLKPLLTHAFSLGQLDEAFEHLEQRPVGFLKGWIHLNPAPAMSSQGQSQQTTDHKTIRQWAEKRGGKPARVKATGSDNAKRTGILRIDFPGYSGQEALEGIDWDTFFQTFEEQELALVYQEKTSDGDLSRFNKLISR